jgi:hypothetical protein
VELAAPLRGSQELAAVLACVAVWGGWEVSKTFSTFSSVSSSFDGVIEASASWRTGGSIGVTSSGCNDSSGSDWGITTSGSGCAGSDSTGSGTEVFCALPNC